MMALPKFHGVMPALVTPMKQDLSIDAASFQNLCEWQIKEGVHGLVPVGTTGESPTLSHEEHLRVIELCLEAANGRVPIVAGTGSNNTQEAIALSTQAEKLGADGLLIVTPYYNKPSQEGLYLHYSSIARAVEIPIFIYNIPSRSVVNMEIDTFARLHENFSHIIGVKDATSRLELPPLMRKKIGKDFIQLSGDDPSLVAFLAQGGHGLISVSCNVAPAMHAKLQEAWLQQDLQTVANLRDKLTYLHQACFIEPSPAPTKYALSLMGKSSAYVRSPIVPLQESSKQQIKSCLQEIGLLS